MKTMKFKVGDKVRVKSLEWYKNNKDKEGNIFGQNKEINFIKAMSLYCGQLFTIQEIENDYYLMHDNLFCWQDWMLEDTWMLEDDVVENIKKKVLTKEVAQAVVRNTKYRLENKNENASLQRKLLEMGCKWISGCEEVQHEDCKYLFVSSNLHITMSEREDIFCENLGKELKVNEILNIEIKEMDMQTKVEATKEQKELKVRNKIANASFQPIKKEEAEKLLIGTKFFCVNDDEAEKLQKKLFECGCQWSDIGNNIDVNRWAILVCGGGFLSHLDKEVVSWSDDSYIAILVEDILQMKIIPEETPKFDPKSLQPFDKVLIRDTEKDKWRCNLFCHINEKLKYKYFCVFDNWIYCIPYNEETKHLVGTIVEAPEFYRI